MRSLYLRVTLLRNAPSKNTWYLSPFSIPSSVSVDALLISGSYLTCPEKLSRVLKATRPFAVWLPAALALKREGFKRVVFSGSLVGGNSCGGGSKKSNFGSVSLTSPVANRIPPKELLQCFMFYVLYEGKARLSGTPTDGSFSNRHKTSYFFLLSTDFTIQMT